uniref:Uncharacterized protein n=1 Tax=Anopheles farauti TaxID=69004 RepID=A0A182QKB1_9DIPT
MRRSVCEPLYTTLPLYTLCGSSQAMLLHVRLLLAGTASLRPADRSLLRGLFARFRRITGDRPITVLFLILRTFATAGGLRQGLQDRVHLFGDGHQHKLELLPGGDQAGPLIAQMFQRRRNVNLPCALVHATEHQIEQNVRTGTSGSVAAEKRVKNDANKNHITHDQSNRLHTFRAQRNVPAVDDDGTGAATVGLVHLAAEVEQGLGRRRYAALRPGQEVELGDGARFAGAQILQVERAHQIVVAPDVLADQVHLVDVVHLGTLLGPVAGAGRLTVLLQAAERHQHDRSLFPHHLPEVGQRRLHRPLGGYVGRCARIVIGDGGRIDVVHALRVRQVVQHDARVIVRERRSGTVQRCALACEGRIPCARFRFVPAQGFPFALQPALVAQVILHDDVLERDDGGRASASFVSAVMRPPGESVPTGPGFPPAMRARHRSW